MSNLNDYREQIEKGERGELEEGEPGALVAHFGSMYHAIKSSLWNPTVKSEAYDLARRARRLREQLDRQEKDSVHYHDNDMPAEMHRAAKSAASSAGASFESWVRSSITEKLENETYKHSRQEVAAIIETVLPEWASGTSDYHKGYYAALVTVSEWLNEKK